VLPGAVLACAAETNAAANKEVVVSGTPSTELGKLVDHDPDTCLLIQTNTSSGRAGGTGAGQAGGWGLGAGQLLCMLLQRCCALHAVLCLACGAVPCMRCSPLLLPLHSLHVLCVCAHAVWAEVDLGYYGTVGSVALAMGSQWPAPSGTTFNVYIKDSFEQSLADAQACSMGTVQLVAGGWAAVPCNTTGQ